MEEPKRGKEKDAQDEEEGEEEEIGDEYEEEEEEQVEQVEEAAAVMEDEIERARQIAEERIQAQQQKQWLRTLRDKRIIIRYVHPQPIYLLFNPWHESTCPHFLLAVSLSNAYLLALYKSFIHQELVAHKKQT